MWVPRGTRILVATRNFGAALVCLGVQAGMTGGQQRGQGKGLMKGLTTPMPFQAVTRREQGVIENKLLA